MATILADIWVIETTPDAAAFAAKRALVAEKFARLEAALGESPFFAGSRFSLVDCVFAPVFRYFDVFERFTDLGVFDDLPKLSAWRKALAARPTVRAAAPANCAALLEAFLRNQRGVLAGLMLAGTPARIVA